MIIEYLDDDERKYVYEEVFTSGKKDLFLDGVKFERVAKKQYKLPDSDQVISIKGNFIFGVTLYFSEDKQIPILQNKGYEWALLFLPVLNIAIGILGGPLGAALSGIAMIISIMINAIILRSNQKTTMKVIGCITLTILIIVVWFFLYLYLSGSLFY